MRLYILIGIILACIGFLVYKQRQLKIKEKFAIASPYQGRYVYYMGDFMYDGKNTAFIGNKLYPENSADTNWNNYVNMLWNNGTIRYADQTEIDYYNKMGGYNWTMDGTLVGIAKSPVRLVSSLLKPNTHFGGGYGQANAVTPNGVSFFDSYSDVYNTGYNNQIMFLMRLSSKKENSTTNFSYIRMHDTPSTGAIVSGTTQKEVYHITGYQFTYDDAIKVCTQLGATLATEAQLTDAFNNGAQWCSWGWVNEKKLIYPMQLKCNGCGDVGIQTSTNFTSTSVYGINCYGIKPSQAYKTRYNDISINIAPFYRQECGPVVDPDVYYMYKDAKDADPGRLPPNTVYPKCPPSETSIGLTQDCYNQVWAAKCTQPPQTVQATWSLEWVINDTKAWATLVDLPHRKGCYGNDPTKWPNVTQADKDMIAAQQSILASQKALADAQALMAAAKTTQEAADAQLAIAQAEAATAKQLADAAALAQSIANAEIAKATQMKADAQKQYDDALKLYNDSVTLKAAADAAQLQAAKDKAAADQQLAAAKTETEKAAAMKAQADAAAAEAKAASDKAIAAAAEATNQAQLAQQALLIAQKERELAEKARDAAAVSAEKARLDKLAAQAAADAAALDVKKVEAEKAAIQLTYEQTKLIELNVQNDRAAIDALKQQTDAALAESQRIYEANQATKLQAEQVLAQTEANRQLALKIQEQTKIEAAQAETNRIAAEKAAADAEAAAQKATDALAQVIGLTDNTQLLEAQKLADEARTAYLEAVKAAADAKAKAALTILNAQNADTYAKAIADAVAEAAANKAAAEAVMRQAAQQEADAQAMLLKIQQAESDASIARQNSLDEYNKLQAKIAEAEQIRANAAKILADAQKRQVDAAAAAADAAKEAANAAGQLETIDKAIADINNQIEIIRNATSEAERQANISNLNATLSTLHAKQAELATQQRIKDNEEIALLQAQQEADKIRKQIADIQAQIKQIDTDITNARNQPDYKVNVNAKLEKEAELARLKEAEAQLKSKQTELEAAKQRQDTYEFEAGTSTGAGAGAGASRGFDNSISEDPCACLPDISDSDISAALERTWDNVITKIKTKAQKSKEGFSFNDRFSSLNSRYQMLEPMQMQYMYDSRLRKY